MNATTDSRFTPIAPQDWNWTPAMIEHSTGREVRASVERTAYDRGDLYVPAVYGPAEPGASIHRDKVHRFIEQPR